MQTTHTLSSSLHRYEVRKHFAMSRMRVKGRFVRKEDEDLLCEVLELA